MASIFLSASVPIPGRGRFHETADPFLIHLAVRQLAIHAIRDWQIVWGGHPAITPMIWRICEDLGVEYAQSFVLYQSAYFQELFPDENRRFDNVVVVDAVCGDRAASLRAMRERMLSREDLEAAVFVGGMEGVLEEYDMFRRYHPDARVVPVAAPGGAARDLARLIDQHGLQLESLDFTRLFLDSLPRKPQGRNIGE